MIETLEYIRSQPIFSKQEFIIPQELVEHLDDMKRYIPLIIQIAPFGNNLSGNYPVLAIYNVLREGKDSNKTRLALFQNYPQLKILFHTIASLQTDPQDLASFKKTLTKQIHFMHSELHHLPPTQQTLEEFRKLPYTRRGHKVFAGRYLLKAIFGDSVQEEL